MNEEELFDFSIKVLTKNLPVLRKILELTQSEFADIIGLSRQTIVNIPDSAKLNPSSTVQNSVNMVKYR